MDFAEPPAGITEIEGGGISYCLPYSEAFPLDRALLYWQYVDRVCALHSTKEPLDDQGQKGSSS